MSKDNIKPGDRWEFDSEVADAFDDMLARSIPQYDVMRRACYDIGREFVQLGTDIVDLGCARGGALEAFVQRFGATVSYVGVELSEPMRQACCERFKGMIACNSMRILETDLRYQFPEVSPSLTIASLTLQFIPIEYRMRVLDKIKKSTKEGGALIVVEKVLGAASDVDDLLVKMYYAMKERNGYSREDIDRKRFSLEGVLVPVSADYNETLLRNAGFRNVECFWRWMNFAAWVCF